VENQCQPEEQYEGLFQQASDLIAQIDVLKSELAGLDNASICPECGSKVNDGQKFCPECGHKNASYGKWKAEAEAADVPVGTYVYSLAKTNKEALRDLVADLQLARMRFNETVSDEAEENVFPSDATACDGEDAQ
jgi:predicted amidophosphoribosyltransferase